MQRWVLFMMGYSYTIKYIRTEDNVVADFLSRLPLGVRNDENVKEKPNEADCLSLRLLAELPVTCDQLRLHTRKDPLLATVVRLTKEGWPQAVEDESLKPFFRRRIELSLVRDCLLWGSRVIIPMSLRPRILQELHCGHVGIVRMKSLARAHVWWPGIDSQIEESVKGCDPCQEEKSNPPHVPLHPWEWPDQPWKRLHADFAGPFCGYQFLLIIDAYSKWPEVVRMKNISSEETIKAFRSLFARYGIAERLVTDNGGQFQSAEFAEFIKMNDIRHTFSPPKHPATNGAAENFVGTFKSAMRAYVKQGLAVDEAVLRFLGSYRCVPHTTTGVSPAELLLGRPLRTRLDLLKPSLKDLVRSKQDRQQSSCGGRERSFHIGQRVWTRDFRRGKNWTRAVVTSQLGTRRFCVRTVDGLEWRRHADQMWDAGTCPVDNSENTATHMVPDTVPISRSIPFVERTKDHFSDDQVANANSRSSTRRSIGFRPEGFESTEPLGASEVVPNQLAQVVEPAAAVSGAFPNSGVCAATTTSAPVTPSQQNNSVASRPKRTIKPPARFNCE